MIRQKAPRDPSLVLGATAAVLAPPAPVVMPVRRVEAPEPEPAPTFAPVVTKRGSPAQQDTSSPVHRDTPEPMPLVAIPAREMTPVELWAPPVPTFTYLSGAAGSGKTFATKAWTEIEPGLLLCATTGIAAINLGGETINSVLGYFDTASLQEAYISGFLTARLGKLWRAGVRRLVLDEVSMLAADQLTFLVKAIEEVNGRGYVLGKWAEDDDDSPPPAMGLTLVGDFLQLSPVKATYAFESPEWGRFKDTTITLTEIRRQADPEFIQMLRAARAGQGHKVAEYFQARGAIYMETDDRFPGLTIVAKNESVDRYNGLRMAQLTGPEIRIASSRWGKLRSEWGALDKPKQTWGIPEVLVLKEGALVMVLANYRDELRRLRYVNGDLGTVVDATETTVSVRLQRTGEVELIMPVTRQVKVPIDSARRTELRKLGQQDKIEKKWEIVGEVSYMPLRVAYASTVHKTQGLSLDSVQINTRDRFFATAGMAYVALSRVRTMEGLRLVGSPQGLVERCVSDPRLRSWL
jgi:ATP-dependent DNA helicase PIF1